MQVITNIKSFSTGIYSEYANIQSIEIDDQNTLGAGAFGEVYPCISINGGKKTPVAQAIKVFLREDGSALRNFQTIEKLQKRLNEENRQFMKSTSKSLLENVPGFLGCPQFSFTGELAGKSVRGFSANNLKLLGFEEFKNITDFENPLSDAYEKVPMIARMQIAWHLAYTFDVLKRNKFIHADFKEEAVFVDLKTYRCAIIDYDSGAVVESENDVPGTPGTLQQWLAPEISTQLRDNDGRLSVNLHTDLWSFNMGIHCILFKVTPLFFLKEISEQSMNAYFSKFEFPNCNASFPFFEEDSENFHSWYVNNLSSILTPEIANKIQTNIQYGYFDPSRRVSASQWKLLLQVTQSPPKIKNFKSSVTKINNLSPVRFEWEIENAFSIMIDGVDVTGRQFYDIPIRRDKEIVLIASNPFGKNKESIRIEVSKNKPQIKFFKSDKQMRNNQSPCLLYWIVEGYETLSIDQGTGDVSNLSEIEVFPTKETVYTLTAISIFGAISTSQIKITVSKLLPKIIKFKADKIFLRVVESVRLSWHVEDAVKVEIDNGIGEVNGQSYIDVLVNQDTMFILTATNFFGFSDSSVVIVQVTRVPPRIMYFKSNKTILVNGESAMLSWDVKDAVKVFIDNEEYDSRGALEVCPDKDITYTLKAIGVFGRISENQLRIAVRNQSPTINLFKATPMMIYAGQEAEIFWKITRADTVSIDNGIGVVQSEGKIKVMPLTDTTYTLTCRNNYGELRNQIIIRVLQKPVLQNLNVSLLKPPTLKK
jgi:serine/threonine protein kinase